MGDKAGVAIIIAIIGLIGTLGAAAISAGWIQPFRATPTPAVVPSLSPSDAGFSPTNSTIPSTATLVPATSNPVGQPPTGCVVTIRNPLVALMSEPSSFSRELVSIEAV